MLVVHNPHRLNDTQAVHNGEPWFSRNNSLETRSGLEGSSRTKGLMCRDVAEVCHLTYRFLLFATTH